MPHRYETPARPAFLPAVMLSLLTLAALIAEPARAGGNPEDYPLNAAAWEAGDALHRVRYFKEGDPHVTTSKCIGNPITPLCAAETFLAGSSDDRLRDIAQGEVPGIKDFRFEPPHNPHVSCHQLTGYWYYHEKDFAFRSEYPLKAGDVALKFRHGYMVRGKCHLDFYPGSNAQGLLMRRGSHGWYVAKEHHAADFVREPYRSAHDE